MNGLLQRITGQDSKGDGDARIQAELTKTQADLSIDMLVMSRFTANHGTQAENSGELAGMGQTLSGKRDFPGTGNPRDRNRLVVHTRGLQRLESALQELARYRFVVTRDDDRE